MNSLRYFVGKKNKLSYILKKADALGFTDMNVDNNAFKTLALIRDYCFEPRVQNKLEYLSITLDFREFMYFMDNEEKMYNWFQGMECKMTHVDLDVYTIDFIYYLNDLMNNNKLIYLFINFDGYGVDEDEIGHYACHSVCGIFIPMGKGIYKFNYINSHGDAMKTTDYLEHRLSSTRVKKIKFKEPVDVILMRSFIKFINKNIETHNHIIYKGNELDTYYGVNLQSGDDHGICFVIPFLLYYYLGNNYYKPFDKTNDLFSSASKLLKENRVMDFVHYSFVDFHPEFKFIMINSVWLKERLALLEKCLQKSGFRFIKDITNTLVSFMGQSYFQKKIINTY